MQTGVVSANVQVRQKTFHMDIQVQEQGVFDNREYPFYLILGHCVLTGLPLACHVDLESMTIDTWEPIAGSVIPEIYR